jgi:hypothetical protein
MASRQRESAIILADRTCSDTLECSIGCGNFALTLEPTLFYIDYHPECNNLLYLQQAYQQM